MNRLRATVHLLLVLSLVLGTQSLLLVQVAFEVQQDFIAEHLCVNRDRPELDCNGHCVLAERHNDAQEHHEQKQAVRPDVSLSFSMLIPARAVAAAPTAEPHFYAQPPRLPPSDGSPRGVFRPPQA